MPDPTSNQLMPGERVLFRCGKATTKLPISYYVAMALLWAGAVLLVAWPHLFESDTPVFVIAPAMLVPVAWIVVSLKPVAAPETTITDQRLFFVSGFRREVFAHSDIAEVHLVNTRCLKSIVLWHPDGRTTELFSFQDPASVYDALIKFLGVQHSNEANRHSEKLTRIRSIHSKIVAVFRFLGMSIWGSLAFILFLLFVSNRWEAYFIWIPLIVAAGFVGALIGNHWGSLFAWKVLRRYIPLRDVQRFFPRLSEAGWKFMRPFWRYSFKKHEQYLTRLYGTKIKLVRE